MTTEETIDTMTGKDKLPFNACMRKELKRKYKDWLIWVCITIDVIAGGAVTAFILEKILDVVVFPLYMVISFVCNSLVYIGSHIGSALVSINPIWYLIMGALSIPFWHALYVCINRQLTNSDRECIAAIGAVVCLALIAPIIFAICGYSLCSTTGNNPQDGIIAGFLLGFVFDIVVTVNIMTG